MCLHKRGKHDIVVRQSEAVLVAAGCEPHLRVELDQNGRLALEVGLANALAGDENAHRPVLAVNGHLEVLTQDEVKLVCGLGALLGCDGKRAVVVGLCEDVEEVDVVKDGRLHVDSVVDEMEKIGGVRGLGAPERHDLVDNLVDQAKVVLHDHLSAATGVISDNAREAAQKLEEN